MSTNDISIELFGQELNDQTYAVCKSDQLISGENPENIHGPNLSTLSQDQLPDKKFDYILANPPYGVSWKKEESYIKEESKDPNGRFFAGVPAVSDGSFLFVQHMVSKMSEEGSRVGIILSASPLFQGKAGQGPSNIRKWLFESDLVEAIIQLPDRLFYNTGIATITATGSYSQSISYSKVGTKNYKVKFDSTQTIYTQEYEVEIKPMDYNNTMNRTMRAINPSSSLFQAHNESPYIGNQFTSSNWTPYVTQINLYDAESIRDGSEPLIIGRLPRPVKLRKDMTIRFRVKLDM